MRTNEIEALKGWKIPVACGLEKHLSHLLTQWNCFQIPPLAQWSGIQEMLMNGRNGWIYNHSSHLKSIEQVDPGLSRIWKKALWLLLSERQRGYPNTCVHNADHLRMGEVPHNVAVWNHAEERLLTCTLWESTEPSMYVVFFLKLKIIRSWEWLRLKFKCIPGKRTMLAATMRAASLQNMRKAATTLPDSDTGFVVRALGSIWPNSIRLQDLLPILTCLGCSHVSYHMKCTKTNMLMQRQFWSCFHQPTGVIPSK